MFTHPSRLICTRIVAVLVGIVLVHFVDEVVPLFFIVLAAAGGLMVFSSIRPVPYLPQLSRLAPADRLALWIVLVVLGVIGYLHNANHWVREGLVLRPQVISLWKTELILVISLAAPLTHWLAGILFPRVVVMSGQRFATEFALYVNFSGIALVLWSGDEALSLFTLGAALALIVMAELTLYTSNWTAKK